ncbi:MAG TPA: gamma-glutamyltransferase [Micromonosporaceae bacterium]
MPAGVAANHPSTAEVGLRMLSVGGSAADAAVAATLACCVAESIVTGLGGGGFATCYEAATGTVTCLDFFCAYPGLGAEKPAEPMVPIEVLFGPVAQAYEIGAASVGVPGVPAGLAGVHGRWGRLPWDRVVAPAIGLARAGVVLPAGLARTLRAIGPAMTPGAGGEIYAPAGRLLTGGDLMHQPDLVTSLRILAERGPRDFYLGDIAAATVDVVRDGGGVLTEEDLRAYRVREVPIATARFAGRSVHGRFDLNGTINTLSALPALAEIAPGPRAVTLANTLHSYGHQRLGDTSNISVVDADGNACVITLTLGIGSGVWVPGTGIHLNSMLGERDIAVGPAVPGIRMSSMMCPLVVTRADGTLELAIGSAGASRIRSALIHTLIGILVDDLSTAAAIARPRFHVVGPDAVHVEPGRSSAELSALREAGFDVTEWDTTDPFFGCVSAVGAAGAGADHRRGGVGVLLD